MAILAANDTPLSKLTPEQMAEGVNLASELIRADYYADVRGLAQDIADRIKDGEITNAEELDQALHEDCDGSQRVIYTWQARLGLLATDNEDAYEEVTGEAGGGAVETRMYYALREDVQEELERVHDVSRDWDGARDDDGDAEESAHE